MEITRKFCDRCGGQTEKLTTVYGLYLRTQYNPDEELYCNRWAGAKNELCDECLEGLKSKLLPVFKAFMGIKEIEKSDKKEK